MKKSLSVKLALAISLLCFLIGFMFLALPKSLTKEVFAETQDTITLGNFDESSHTFSNATGIGTETYQYLAIYLGETIVDENNYYDDKYPVTLPSVSGYNTENQGPQNKDQYVITVEFTSSHTASDIAENYIKQIVFDFADKQSVQFVLMNSAPSADVFFNALNGHYYQFVEFNDGAERHHWIDAYNAAKGMTFDGRTGYLATITSFEEDLFVYNASSKVGFLGGTVLSHGEKIGNLYYDFTVDNNSIYDKPTMKTWYWACGPERGQTFFKASDTGTLNDDYAYEYNKNLNYYFNWLSGEPNGGNAANPSDECCLTTLDVGTAGYAAIAAGSNIPSSWNDMPEYALFDFSSAPKYSVKGYFVEFGNQVIGDSGASSMVSATGYIGYPIQINDDYFGTLQEAINAVENNGTIKLVKNIGEEQVVVSKEITFSIDNNGFTNNANITAGEGYVITPSASGNVKTFVVEATDWTKLNNALTSATPTAQEGLFSVGVDNKGTVDASDDCPKITLLADFTAVEGDTTLMVTGEKTLELNGFVINANGGAFNVITVAENAILNLYDCGTKSHNGYVDENGLWHLGEGSGIAKAITGGIITGANKKSTTNGGGVYVDKGVFNMYGGNIVGNTATNGGAGIYITGGTFEMNGGAISYNYASVNNATGGGIYGSNSTIILNSGTINNNSANGGGGIYLLGTSSMEMNGGIITENKARGSQGGGILASFSGKFTMTAGSITNNQAVLGGGIFVNSNNENFSMSGGTISGNNVSGTNNKGTIYSGGGIYLNNFASATFGGTAKITGNTLGSENPTVNNLFLPTGKTITLDNPTTMSIGITLQNITGDFATSTTNYLSCFTSDNEIYSVKAKEETTYTYSIVHEHEEDGIDFQAWTKNNSLPTTAGNYVLTCDVTLTSTWNVPEGTTNLCLNGYVINANGGNFSVITIPTDATLNLYDCGTTSHNGYVDANGLWHYDSTGTHQIQNGETEKTIAGGVITGVNNFFGGCVNVSGTFNMYGGNIAGNTASVFKGGGYGGGVNVASNGTFAMIGGMITGNTALSAGGGVYNNGIMVVGGTAQITGNTANGVASNLYLTTGTTITLGTKTQLEDGNGVLAPTEDMQIGITLADDTGVFTTNGTANDVAYFFSDSDSYKVCFNNKGTEEDTTDDYLELKTAYAITNSTKEDDKATNHGYIVAPKNAVEGEKVVVTVVPNSGYELSSLIYNDGTNHDITATAGVYSFEMPATAVSITATFVVEKQTISISEIPYTCTYTGEPMAFQLTSGEGPIPTGLKFEYYVDDDWTENAPTNAGSYNVKITRDEDGTYKAYEKVIENGLVIAKAEVEVPTIASKTYAGNTGYALTADVEISELYEVTENNGGINAGKYDVKLALIHPENYKWKTTDDVEITLEFIVDYAKINKVGFGDVSQPVATETAPTTVKGIAIGSRYAGTISWSPTLVEGNFDYNTVYTVTITLDIVPSSIDNYRFADGFTLVKPTSEGWTKSNSSTTTQLIYTKTFEKTGKIPQAVEITNDISKTYNKQAVSVPTYTRLGDGTVTIEYKLASEDDDKYTTTAPTNAGSYVVRVSVADTETHSSGYATKEFTISPKEMTVTIENKTSVYGEDIVSLTYTQVGLVAGDDITSLFTLTTNATKSSDVDTYSIVGQTGNSTLNKNYTITFVGESGGTDGVYTITQAEAIIDVSGLTKEYMYTGYPITIQSGATLNHNETSLSYSDNTHTDVGQHLIKISAEATKNYSAVTQYVEIEIKQAINKITNLSITGWTYGAYNKIVNAPSANADFGEDGIEYTYSNEENGTYESTVPTTAGTYWVKATVAETTNYEEAVDKLSFTIATKALKITINNQTSKYGEDIVSLTYTQVGLVAEDDITKLFTLTTEATKSSEVGTYSIVGKTGNSTLNKNYTITFVGESGGTDGVYTITQAEVTKPAENATYFVYNETEQTYELDLNPLYTIEGNKATNIGTYPVTVSLNDPTNYKWKGDSSSDDLEFTFVINQRAQDIAIHKETETGVLKEKSEVSITEANDGIAPGAVLVVKVIEIKNIANTENAKQALEDKNKIAQKEKIYGLYDAKLMLEGEEIQPNGNITIKMLVPTQLRNVDFRLYHIHKENTNTINVIDINYTAIDKDGYITFVTDKLSEFAFVAEAPSLSLCVIIVIFVILLLLIIYLLVYFLCYRKGKLDDKKIRVIYKILPRGNKNLPEDKKDNKNIPEEKNTKKNVQKNKSGKKSSSKSNKKK